MDTDKIIAQLAREYPHAPTYVNDIKNPTEVICEVEPVQRHSGYNASVCVVNRTSPHYHKQANQIYYVLKGTLTLYINDQKKVLQEDEVAVVQAGEVHWATGKETWIELYSEPAVSEEDTFTPQEYISAAEAPAENTLLVELYSNKMDKTKEFYLELGFHLVWGKEKDKKHYVVLQKEGNILCFSNTLSQKNNSNVLIMVPELNTYHDELTSHMKVPAITTNDWGFKQFELKDPTNTLVKFIEPHNILTPR